MSANERMCTSNGAKARQECSRGKKEVASRMIIHEENTNGKETSAVGTHKISAAWKQNMVTVIETRTMLYSHKVNVPCRN